MKTENEALKKTLKQYLPLLNSVPYSREFFLVGSFAQQTATKDSDIDLVVIAKPNRVWINRSLMIFVVALARKKRTRQKRSLRFCFNATVANRTEVYNLSKIYGLPKPLLTNNNENKVLKNTFEFILDVFLLGPIADRFCQWILTYYVRWKFKKFEDDKNTICILDRNRIVYHPPK
jgi:predicted nucleotidyltransferase